MKKNFLYRLLVLAITYILIGAILFASLAKASLPTWVFWLILGIYVLLFVVSVVVVEVLQNKSKKTK